MKTFDSILGKYFRLIVIFAIAQFGMLALSVILRLFSIALIRWFIIFLLIVDVLAINALIIFLFSKYKSTPITKEKSEKQNVFTSLNSQLQNQNNDLKETIENREKIAKNEEKKLQNRSKEHDRTLANLAQLKKSSEKQLADELSGELSKIQARYIRDNMQNTRLKDSKIPSFGPKTKETLAKYGVISASDIDFAHINNIPGFGESKAKKLVAWQDEVRRNITRNAPKKLPKDTEQGIRSKFEEYFESLKHQVNKENLDFDQDKQSIRTEAIDLQQENDEHEIKVKEIISGLEPDVNAAKEELSQYRDIIYKNFVSGIINTGKESIPALKSISPAPVFLLLAGTLDIQTITGFAAGTNIIIDAIPTNTFTPTHTYTPSYTFTPSYTPTPTDTHTPRITNTPTITDTPTITLTPSETMTPTITNTPTVTLAASISGSSCIPDNERVVGFVNQIIDGDTIGVVIDGYSYRIRYIGVDSPETNNGYEYYGYEAYIYNSNLVYGKYVVLIKDTSDVDQYDRLLRYVIVDDKFVNYDMVLNGYANSATYPPDVACADMFVTAQRYAVDHDNGLWAPTKTPAPVFVAPSSSDCHPSYPSLCLPVSGPDINCSDISAKRFTVLQPDTYGLDGDGDGIGCEN